MKNPSNKFWNGKRVLITGHSGFKRMANNFTFKIEVCDHWYKLPPENQINLFDAAGVSKLCESYFCEITDKKIKNIIQKADPEIVFHLAAQPLVSKGYSHPLETMQTNIIGTTNLLEVLRSSPSVKAIIIITTDKVYENKEWFWGYRETDRLGGFDPYSASKAATEIVTQSYRRSFFLKER